MGLGLGTQSSRSTPSTYDSITRKSRDCCDSVIGSSVWLTHSVEPKTTVTMEKPRLRIRAEIPDELKPELNYSI